MVSAPPPHHLLGAPRRRTPPFVKFAVILCSILAVAVILSGLAIIIGYLVLKPKVPKVVVAAAQLDNVYFDQSNILSVQITSLIRFENHNAKARAGFYHTDFGLTFHGRRIATLTAGAFDIAGNSSVTFNYVAQSSAIPLSPEDAEALSWTLGARDRTMRFELAGKTRTWWHVWLIGSAKFWLQLDCRLKLPVNGTRVYPECISTYK